MKKTQPKSKHLIDALLDSSHTPETRTMHALIGGAVEFGSSAAEYEKVSKMAKRIHAGRPVPQDISAKMREDLDAVLASGDRSAAKAALHTLHAFASHLDTAR